MGGRGETGSSRYGDEVDIRQATVRSVAIPWPNIQPHSTKKLEEDFQTIGQIKDSPDKHATPSSEGVNRTLNPTYWEATRYPQL